MGMVDSELLRQSQHIVSLIIPLLSCLGLLNGPPPQLALEQDSSSPVPLSTQAQPL